MTKFAMPSKRQLKELACEMVGGHLLKKKAIRFLTVAEIIPLKLCPRLWVWLLVKLGRI